MRTHDIARQLWLEDSGLSAAEIADAVQPAYAVLTAAGMSPQQAYSEYMELVDAGDQDRIYNSTWARAERSITADLRASAVMTLG